MKDTHTSPTGATPLPETAITTDRPVLGMAAASGAVLMLTLMNVFAKLLSGTHHLVEIAFYRNAIAILPFLAMIFIFGRRDMLKINSQPRALVARSVVGTVSLIATFGAFSLLPLADGQALLFTASLFVPMLGYFFLQEKVGPYRWSAVLIGFAGMLIMVRPSGDVALAGVALALFAALMHATLGTLLRLLGRTEKPETTAFYFLLIGCILTAPFMPFVGTIPRANEAWFFLGAGLSGALGQILLSIAFKYAPAALVTIFNYTGIIWATAFGWFIWSDWPEPPVFYGAGIIIASSLFIVWREQRLARRATPVPPGPALPK